MTSPAGAPQPPPRGADPIRANIAEVARLERAAWLAQTLAQRLAAAITRTAGSAPVILLHALWFLVWTVWNLGLLPGVAPFDPFPFAFLVMLVSFEVIFLTLFVLRSQNDMAAHALKRAHLDLQLALLTERELTLILRMLTEVSARVGVSSASAQELEHLLKDTDVTALAARLDTAFEDR